LIDILSVPGTFEGIFNQILSGEEVVRERSIKFLATRYKALGATVITKEVEDYVITEIKKVLQVNVEHHFSKKSTIDSICAGRDC